MRRQMALSLSIGGVRCVGAAATAPRDPAASPTRGDAASDAAGSRQRLERSASSSTAGSSAGCASTRSAASASSTRTALSAADGGGHSRSAAQGGDIAPAHSSDCEAARAEHRARAARAAAARMAAADGAGALPPVCAGRADEWFQGLHPAVAAALAKDLAVAAAGGPGQLPHAPGAAPQLLAPAFLGAPPTVLFPPPPAGGCGEDGDGGTHTGAAGTCGASGAAAPGACCLTLPLRHTKLLVQYISPTCKPVKQARPACTSARGGRARRPPPARPVTARRTGLWGPTRAPDRARPPQAFRRAGFKPTKGCAWSVMWGRPADVLADGVLRELGPFQRINHFPGRH
jgi:hypothetical protein